MKAGENLEVGCLAMVVKLRTIGILGHSYGEIVKCLNRTEMCGEEYWFVENKQEVWWWHEKSGLLRLPDLDDDNEESCAILPKTPPKINNLAKELT